MSNVDSFVVGVGSLSLDLSLADSRISLRFGTSSLLFVTRHLADSTTTVSNHETLLLTMIGRARDALGRGRGQVSESGRHLQLCHHT